MDSNSLRATIWQVVALIPRGRVATYGQVARLAGHPNHARYVGTVLRQLPADSRLPWHRVLCSGGRLAFAADSSNGRRQRSRLEAEGVIFNAARVDLNRFGLAQISDPLHKPAD